MRVLKGLPTLMTNSSNHNLQETATTNPVWGHKFDTTLTTKHIFKIKKNAVSVPLSLLDNTLPQLLVMFVAVA